MPFEPVGDAYQLAAEVNAPVSGHICIILRKHIDQQFTKARLVTQAKQL